MSENKEKKYGIKGTDYVIYPLKPEEVVALLSQEKEPAAGLVAIVSQNIKRNEEKFGLGDPDYLWYTAWDVFHVDKDKEKTHIGYMCFNGGPALGHVELSIFLDATKCGRGYGTEVLRMCRNWAFNQKDVYEVDAYIDETNEHAISAYSKAGFVYRGREEDGKEYYSVMKRPTYWMGIYIVVGIWAGIVLGIILNNSLVGLTIGLLSGLGVGTTMEQKAKAKQLEITGSKKVRRKAAVNPNHQNIV